MHGCADELAEVVDRAGPSRVVLVGDLFTKGPDAAGVFAQIREGGFEAVLGNHDANLLDVVDGKKGGRGQKVVDLLQAKEPGWLAYTRALPLFLDVAGVVVVHAGLDPVAGRAGTTRQQALNLRRFPQEEPKCLHWWQQAGAEETVVFGHDAVHGLVAVRRAGRPWRVGLDSGCVYGRQLTGWVVEEDRYFAASARRAYAEMKP